MTPAQLRAAQDINAANPGEAHCEPTKKGPGAPSTMGDLIARHMPPESDDGCAPPPAIAGTLGTRTVSDLIAAHMPLDSDDDALPSES